jgi:hypothetical protein
MIDALKRLDLPDADQRLAELAEIFREAVEAGDLPAQTEEVNNHVHSCYSFSPYNPSQAAFMAWRAGLKAVGIMDHDSFAGAGEMVGAGKILGMGTTCGVELRVSADGTPMEGRSLNNPGSAGTFYMAIHGIPSHQAGAVARFLLPIHKARNERNREQVSRLNELIAPFGLGIDFDAEVYAASKAAAGGSVTERHILAALAQKIMKARRPGPELVSFVRDVLGVPLPAKIGNLLADPKNPHYIYDLLGVLKSQFLPRFFVQPGSDECIAAKTAVDFARTIGAIPAYAYLGDVGESPTGDKKAEKFEDSFLDELMDTLAELGYLAVTYMPPRNSIDQLKRLMRLCDEGGFMQISGVDINSSRQKFTCPEVLLPEFRHLNRSTWALIAHERISSELPGRGLFGEQTLADPALPLVERIEYYARLGESLDLHELDIAEAVRKGGHQ